MALVVFLRGVNVGGHRLFRPSAIAKEMAGLDVVNMGAAGTFTAAGPDCRPNQIRWEQKGDTAPYVAVRRQMGRGYRGLAGSAEYPT